MARAAHPYLLQTTGLAFEDFHLGFAGAEALSEKGTERLVRPAFDGRCLQAYPQHALGDPHDGVGLGTGLDPDAEDQRVSTDAVEGSGHSPMKGQMWGST